MRLRWFRRCRSYHRRTGHGHTGRMVEVTPTRTLFVRLTHDSRVLGWRWSWHPAWNDLDGELVAAVSRTGLVRKIRRRTGRPVEVIGVDEF